MWPMSFRKVLSVAMVVLIAMSGMPIGLAQAKMITTDQVLEETHAASDRTKVETFLSREDVRKQLTSMGIDPTEAESRVASLSDEEIRKIAGQLDELPAGEGAVGAIVGAALIVFLVLLVTDLLGLTDVFTFVKK